QETKERRQRIGPSFPASFEEGKNILQWSVWLDVVTMMGRGSYKNSMSNGSSEI
ncbi:hypothetical protein HKBW3S06_01096, partial [Candidatus Hakubella thermalkaliphila]